MARVSVIIPAYNPGPYLTYAIQSVCDQTFTDWELIVVDDGSTQDLTAFKDEFAHIKFLRIANGGAAAARNVGILETTGEFVAFLDSDDVWHKTKLAEQVDFMDRNADVALCHTDVDYIDATGTKIGSQQGLELLDSYISLLRGPCAVTSSVIMRRSILMDVGMFNPLVFLCEDYDLFLKVARSHKIAHLPLTLTSYRKLEESLSSDYERMDQQLQQLCDRHFLHPQSEETKKAARIGYKNHRMHIGRTAYDQGRKAFRERNWGAFFKHLLAALKRNPRFILLSLLHWLKLRVVPGATTSSAHDQSRF